MGQNNDLSAILILLGLGYLVMKSRKVTEYVGGTITEYRESQRPWIMYSPLYLPPEPWRPIPGPAGREPPLNGHDNEGAEEEPSPGIPGPAYAPRERSKGFFRLPTGPRGPLWDTITGVMEATTKAGPIPGPASQPRWPIKIGPRIVTPPMASGLEAHRRREQAFTNIPPSPETSSFTGGEYRE